MNFKRCFWKAAACAVFLTGAFAGGALANPAHMGQNHMEPNHVQNSHMSDRFGQMDKNGDGKVVLEEFRAAFPNMSEQAFAVIDANGDKGIERAEWFDFTAEHAKGARPRMGTAPRLNNIPGDPLIPSPDSGDLPLMRPSN